MIEIAHTPAEKLVTIRASGTLSAEDYDRALPQLEQAIAESNEALNAVVILDALEGMDAGALWKDLRFDVKHYGDFRRIAVVGRTNVEEIAASASGLVTGADVSFFLVDALDEARDWARGA